MSDYEALDSSDQKSSWQREDADEVQNAFLDILKWISAPAETKEGSSDAQGDGSTKAKDLENLIRHHLGDDTQKRTTVFTMASTETDHRLRTLLMAASTQGNTGKFRHILRRVKWACTKKESGSSDHVLDPEKIERQLTLKDVYGMQLLMHAASSGKRGIFTEISELVERHQFRDLLLHRDGNGMTILMHAASKGLQSGTSKSLKPTTQTTEDDEEGRSPYTFGRETTQLSARRPAGTSRGFQDGIVWTTYAEPDDWVPHVQAVFNFIRPRLFLVEYRKLLIERDDFGRSIIEHAILSGSRQVFDTVFELLRRDIHDDVIDNLMDAGDGEEDDALRNALLSMNGQIVMPLFTAKAKYLKKDVGLRTEASSAAAKIQSFIPGNLIVIFQLLLPQLNDDSDEPLMLLLGLCAVAPLWSWGTSLMMRYDPKRDKALPRVTLVRFLLAVPAMFFWGLGTSRIAVTSFGWVDSASAAVLAVATIIIPAVDSFFGGRGARVTWTWWALKALSFWDWLRDRRERRSTMMPPPGTSDEVEGGSGGFPGGQSGGPRSGYRRPPSTYPSSRDYDNPDSPTLGDREERGESGGIESGGVSETKQSGGDGSNPRDVSSRSLGFELNSGGKYMKLLQISLRSSYNELSKKSLPSLADRVLDKSSSWIGSGRPSVKVDRWKYEPLLTNNEEEPF